jgi:hypothetical protein
MKRALLSLVMSAGVAGGFLASPSVASAQSRDAADKALRQQYPKGNFNVTGTRVVNGVTVYDVGVQTPEGGTYAQVTDKGEFVSAGQPMKMEQTPATVQNTAKVFKEMQNLDQFVANYYNVFIGEGSQRFQIVFEPTGRLVDIYSPQALARQAPSAQQQTTPEVKQSLTSSINGRFPNAKINEISQWSEGQGMYSALFTTGDDRTAYFVFDEKGVSVIERIRIPVSEVPQVVQQTVKELFNSPIQDASRGTEKFWRLRQRGGDEQVAIKIRPNGEIASIRTEAGSTDKAVPASSRQKK